MGEIPLWLFILLGGGFAYYAVKQGQAQAAAAASVPSLVPSSSSSAAYDFQVGQIVTIAMYAQMFSDPAMTKVLGSWPGGTSRVTAIDPNGAWVGFTSQSGTGTIPIYIGALAVTPSGTAV